MFESHRSQLINSHRHGTWGTQVRPQRIQPRLRARLTMGKMNIHESFIFEATFIGYKRDAGSSPVPRVTLWLV